MARISRSVIRSFCHSAVISTGAGSQAGRTRTSRPVLISSAIQEARRISDAQAGHGGLDQDGLAVRGEADLRPHRHDRAVGMTQLPAHQVAVDGGGGQRLQLRRPPQPGMGS